MKELTRRLGALALALGLGLTLAACGESSGLSKREAETYVDGLLRETYLGKVKMIYIEIVMQTMIQGVGKIKKYAFAV